MAFESVPLTHQTDEKTTQAFHQPHQKPPRPLLLHLFFVTLPVIAIITLVTTVYVIWETAYGISIKTSEAENRLNFVYASVFEHAISTGRLDDVQALAQSMIKDPQIRSVQILQNENAIIEAGTDFEHFEAGHLTSEVILSPPHNPEGAIWVLSICTTPVFTATAIGWQLLRMAILLLSGAGLTILVFHIALKAHILRPLNALKASVLSKAPPNGTGSVLSDTSIEEIDELVAGYQEISQNLRADRLLNDQLFGAIEALNGVVLFDTDGTVLASNLHARQALCDCGADDRIPDLETFYRCIEGLNPAKQHEFRHWFVDDSDPTDFDLEAQNGRWLSFTRARLANNARVCTLRDVTRRTHLERQAEQDRRVKEIGRVGSGITHDINNYLLAMTGSVELALQQVPKSSETAELLRSTLEQGDRAKKTTRQILAFLKDQSLTPEAVDPGQACEDLQRYLTARGAHDSSLTAVIDTNLKLRADRMSFDRVLTNLAENSLQQLAEGTAKLHLKFRTLSRPEGLGVEITFEDNCGGFPPEVLDNATDAFFSTKPQGLGTGLGLTMAKEFAYASGGSIHINNIEGGAQVRLVLPAFESNAASPPPDKAPIEARALTGLNVMLIEDSMQNRVLMERMLAQGGNGVISFETLDDIRQAKLQPDAQVDAIVSDFNLPDGNGRQAVELIRSRVSKDIPCVFVSGDGSQAALQHLSRNERLLLKPFSLKELRGAVSDLLERAERA